MKLCHFAHGRLGLIDGEEVLDVTAALDVLPAQTWPLAIGDPLILHLDALVKRVSEIAGGAKSVPLKDAQLLSPIVNPSKVMAVPANYRKHVEIDVMQDSGVDQGVHAKQFEGVERPVETYGLFIKANSSIHGPSQGIERILPKRRTDHEVELAVVIGNTCRSVSPNQALAYVAGYTLGLDMTVRGSEDRSYRKSADGYTVLGPALVTADEIPDPTQIQIWLDLNGERRQSSSVAAMTVGISDLVAFASAFYSLHPGDVILTGTPEGVGPVEPGDIIRVGGTGLGQMEVRVR
jgi:2-keto-4-pentenoate hydratase/2-oxohepta-3-ene-1,7-dioic acid hydratase in catechol pathway